MPNGKLSKLVILLPVILALIGVIAQELFGTISDNLYNSVGQGVGYKPLLLTILLLIAISFSLLLYLLKRKPISVSMQNKHSKKKVDTKRENILKNLSADEKGLLKLYLSGDTKFLTLHYQHPVAKGLEIQGILYQTPSGMIDLKSNFHIAPWAWSYLKEHAELLRLTEIKDP
jgi:hypothetical protein